MSTSTTTHPSTGPDDPFDVAARPVSRIYRVLIGLSALAVLLQGLWAGIFLQHDGQRDAASGWVEVHARGADVAIALAAAAAVTAFVTMRARKDLWVGAAVLTVLPQLLTVLQDYEMMVFGAVLIATMVFFPQGIVPTLGRWFGGRRP